MSIYLLPLSKNIKSNLIKTYNILAEKIEVVNIAAKMLK
jgi:hypothetical protein